MKVFSLSCYCNAAISNIKFRSAVREQCTARFIFLLVATLPPNESSELILTSISDNVATDQAIDDEGLSSASYHSRHFLQDMVDDVGSTMPGHHPYSAG